uniref:Uncharacterized protein n=1 Tax=Romanomermis culicivorax TaxID=13658 RepID=A0A915J424_ROMCU
MEENLPLLDIEFFTDLLNVPYTQINGRSFPQTQTLQDVSSSILPLQIKSSSSNIEAIIVSMDVNSPDAIEQFPPNPNGLSQSSFLKDFEPLFQKLNDAPSPTQLCEPQHDENRKELVGCETIFLQSTENFVFEPICGKIEDGFIETQCCYIPKTVRDVVENMCDNAVCSQIQNLKCLTDNNFPDVEDISAVNEDKPPKTKKSLNSQNIHYESKIEISSAGKKFEKQKQSIRKRKIDQLQERHSPKMDITSVNVAPKCVKFLFHGTKCLHKGLSKRQNVKRLHVSFSAGNCRKYLNVESDDSDDENDENDCPDYDNEE